MAAVGLRGTYEVQGNVLTLVGHDGLAPLDMPVGGWDCERTRLAYEHADTVDRRLCFEGQVSGE